MKNIWKIFTGDLKKLVKQPFALVIIIGLCVIPSLYAWFNIFANWDPYANTGGIPVAVVSLDQEEKRRIQHLLKADQGMYPVGKQ
jgi:putative membrane protein